MKKQAVSSMRVMMPKPSLRLLAGGLLASLLAALPAAGQTPLLYGTSSALRGSNTVQRINADGSANTRLLTADPTNGVNRCTAVAADSWNSKLFLLDAGGSALWSANLDGSGLVLVKNSLTNAPLSVAVDAVNGKLFYTSSSPIPNRNTIQRMDYSGNNNTVLFTASGSAGNGVQRCTALALDTLHGKIFLADAGSKSVWSLNADGTGLTLVKGGLGATPVDLALDVTNQMVYFVSSSATLAANTLQRIAYNGANFATLLTAGSGNSVQRCTSLDLDAANARLYFADAGASALWSLPLAGGSPTLVKSGLAAAAVKRVRLVLPIAKITPAVTSWPAAGGLIYGQALSASTLSGGSASVPGGFAFVSPAFKPNAGLYAAAVVFTPADLTHYNTVSGAVNVAVSKAAPAVAAWPSATPITFGQALSASTLSGGSASVPGGFAFVSPATAPNAGTYSAAVVFTPSDAADYNLLTGAVTVVVSKATPAVTLWPAARGINLGQALSASTLSGGSAAVPGGFAFASPATVPAAGKQAVSVVFTPAAATNYNVVTGSVNLEVCGPVAFVTQTLAPDGFRAQLSASSGCTYHILRAGAVAGSWNEIGTLVMPAAGFGQIYDPNPGLTRAFYRVVWYP